MCKTGRGPIIIRTGKSFFKVKKRKEKKKYNKKNELSKRRKKLNILIGRRGCVMAKRGMVFDETKNCTVRWRQRIILNFLLRKLRNEWKIRRINSDFFIDLWSPRQIFWVSERHCIIYRIFFSGVPIIFLIYFISSSIKLIYVLIFSFSRLSYDFTAFGILKLY